MQVSLAQIQFVLFWQAGKVHKTIGGDFVSIEQVEKYYNWLTIKSLA